VDGLHAAGRVTPKRAVLGAGIVLCLATLAVVLVIRAQSPAIAVIVRQGQGWSVGVPSGWQISTPPPGIATSIVIAAVPPGNGVSTVPSGMVLRKAAGADASFTEDVKLFNVQESFTHPGRMITNQHAFVMAHASAVSITAEYSANGVVVRTLDVLVRGTDGSSYHLSASGSPTVLTDDVIAALIGNLHIAT
jgi:hypothetical protein